MKKEMAQEYMEYDNMFTEYWREEKLDEIDGGFIGYHKLLEADITTNVLYGNYEGAKDLVAAYFEYQSLHMKIQAKLNTINQDLIAFYMDAHGFNKNKQGYWKEKIQH